MEVCYDGNGDFDDDENDALPQPVEGAVAAPAAKSPSASSRSSSKAPIQPKTLYPYR